MNATAIPAPFSTISSVFIGISMTTLSILTLLGNGLVFVAYYRNKNLQKPRYYFFVSLALADFLIGLFSVNFYSIYLLMGYWPLGERMCDLWLSIDYWCCQTSVLNIILIAVNRFISIKYPFYHKVTETPRNVLRIISASWVMSFMLWVPWIIGYPHIVGERTVPVNDCYIQFLFENAYITLGTALVAYFIPVLVLIAINFYIYVKVNQRQRLRSADEAALGGDLDVVTSTLKLCPRSHTTMMTKSNCSSRNGLQFTTLAILRSALKLRACNELPKVPLAEISSKLPLEFQGAPIISLSSSLRPSMRKLYDVTMLASHDHVKTNNKWSLKSPRNISGSSKDSSCKSFPNVLLKANAVNSEQTLSSGSTLVEEDIDFKEKTIIANENCHAENKKSNEIENHVTRDIQYLDQYLHNVTRKKTNFNQHFRRETGQNQNHVGKENYECKFGIHMASGNVDINHNVQKEKMELDANRPKRYIQSENYMFKENTAINITNHESLPHKHQNLQLHKPNKQKKHLNSGVLLLFVVILAFAITWLPYDVFAVIAPFCPTCISTSLWHFGYVLCYVNSFLNPICYCVGNDLFRKTFRGILDDFLKLLKRK